MFQLSCFNFFCFNFFSGYYTEARRALDWLNDECEEDESFFFIFLQKDDQHHPNDQHVHREDIENIRQSYADSKLQRIQHEKK